MSEQYVKKELCKRLDAFGTSKKATNTVYRKLVNWDGESRWTLLFDLHETLAQSADFVNSVMPKDPLVIDSLPATFMCADKYAKLQQQKKNGSVAADQSASKGADPAPSPTAAAAASVSSSAVKNKNKQTYANEAVLVAQNVERVLSMRSLHESLCNVKIAIAQFCNKKRYKTDHITIALFYSLLNTATRIARQIEIFLQELKAM